MFPLLCLVTFGIFSIYWILEKTYQKSLGKIKYNKSKQRSQIQLSKTLLKQSANNKQIKQQNQGQVKVYFSKQQSKQSKLTGATAISSTDSSKLPSNIQKAKLNTKNYSQQQQQIQDQRNKLGFKQIQQNNQQCQIGSASNLLDVAIIEDNNCNQSKYKTQSVQNKVQENFNILSRLKNQQAGQAYQKASSKQTNLTNYQNNDNQPVPLVESKRQLIIQRRQERSQLQFIQALSTDKTSQKIQQFDFQLISEMERKYSQPDLHLNKLIQQIDQLFQNNQQKFMKIINKYKVNEVRYDNTMNQIQIRKYALKIKELEMQLNKKNQDMDILEIQLSQYKTTSQKWENQALQLKNKLKIIEQQTNNIQQNNYKIPKQYPKQYIKQQQNKNKTYIQVIQQQLTQKQNQINNLKQHLTTQNQYIQKLSNKLKEVTQNNQQKQQLCRNLQKLVEIKNGIVEKLRKEVQNKNIGLQNSQSQDTYRERINQQIYMRKLHQFQQEIQKIRDQAIKEKKKYDEAIYNSLSAKEQEKLDLIKQKQYANFEEYREHSDASQKPRHIKQDVCQLQTIIQNLKNQIQFAQTQIRMFEQAELSHLKQIQQLQKQLQLAESIPKTEIIQLRAKISRMQPIVNQYQIMQRRYFQLKIKYEKLAQQKGRINKSGSSQNQKKEEVTNNIQKIAAFNIDLPNSPKNSLNKDRQDNPIGNYRFLFDCSFITLQDRQFVYEKLRSLLKGILKTQKIYNSKINKTKNPHQLIDNIRGILVIIQLQKDKILGAYTHQSFSSSHPQSTNDNIAFILDITNKHSFVNQSGFNSIAYNPNGLVWGFNQIMLKYQQMDVMYTNFCRNHNIYWDGKYKIQDFIGADKQWARIQQYQIFRVTKI